MPQTVYDTRYWAAVSIGSFKYMFKTNLQDSLQNDLGVVEYDFSAPPLPEAGLIFKANSPKPPRVGKKIAGYNVSCFADPTKLGVLNKDKWRIIERTYRRPICKYNVGGGTNGSAGTVKVTVEAMNYAWNIPDFLRQAPTFSTHMSALGLSACSESDIDQVFWGASNGFPRPAQASFVNPDGTITHTTFVEQTKEDSLPAGWKLSSRRISLSSYLGLS
jgi:hypothetical protein